MFSSKSLFFMTAAATTLFIITILSMVAMLVGDPNAPANLWFNKHGGTVLTVEIVLIGVVGMAAMLADRRETLKESRGRRHNPVSTDPQTENENPPQ